MEQEIVKKLEKKLGFSISKYETCDLSEYFYVEDYEDFIETCEEFDYSKILKEEKDFEVDDLEISIYSVASDERDITAWIITMPNGEVFSYGYSGD